MGLGNVIDKLQEKYEAEKLAALKTQKGDYEKQFKKFVDRDYEEAGENDGVLAWLADDDKERALLFRTSLETLHSSLMKAVGMVREANQLAEELESSTRFSATLQIPARNLSPNNFNGFLTEPTIQANKKGQGRQFWSMDKMDARMMGMREVHQQVKDGIGTVRDIGSRLKDPFFDEIESHALVGVANLYLSVLFHDIAFEHYAPIITQDGKVAGKLLMQIKRIEGNLPNDRLGHCDQDSESTSTVVSEDNRSSVGLQIKIIAAVGIPPALSHFLFCQYKFFRDEEFTVVPSLVESRHVRTKKVDTVDFRFQHERTVNVPVDEYFVEYCEAGCLSVEVYGHKSQGFFSARDALDQKRKAQSLADRYSIAHPDLCWVCFDLKMKCHHVQSRWSELVRKLEVWVEIHEMDDQGRYTPVEIQQRDDVGTGGIYQLRHGQQRRIVARVKPVHNTGNLPIVCDSISALEAGNPVVRSKHQRPLDSYQEDDLIGLRAEWARSITSLKEDVDKRIHRLDEKEHKSADDAEFAQSLLDQKNCIVEELNAALMPGENSVGTMCTTLGMEKNTPIMFLNLDSIDSLDSSVGLEDYLPCAGESSALPLEQEDKFYSLPIIESLSQTIGCIAAWDSSVHDSVYLNRVTQEHERLFLILRITLRIIDPLPLDVVLRKRICFSVYKRHSFVSKFRKSLGYSTNNLLRSTGVTYELVGSVPNTFGKNEVDNTTGDRDGSAESQESFFDDYTQAVSSVETILNLERLKQQDMVLDLLARKESVDAHPNLPKMLSVPSLGNSKR